MLYSDYSTLSSFDELIVLLIVCFVYISIFIVTTIAWWKLFKKADRPGWAALIPVYSLYVIFDIVYDEGLKFLTLFIPFYNIYVSVKLYVDLAQCYGYHPLFGVGAFLLSPIFIPIMAFSDSVYWGSIY